MNLKTILFFFVEINGVCCFLIFTLFVCLGDESKVPNMQDVVRKLLNALHQAVMTHVVRLSSLIFVYHSAPHSIFACSYRHFKFC